MNRAATLPDTSLARKLPPETAAPSRPHRRRRLPISPSLFAVIAALGCTPPPESETGPLANALVEPGEAEMPPVPPCGLPNDSDLIEISATLGATLAHDGTTPLTIRASPDKKVFTVVATALDCVPGEPGCEPDRYELDFGDVGPIYGLGMQGSADRVGVRMFPKDGIPGVEEFLDTAFSSGHLRTHREWQEDPKGREYDTDMGRMRTPMFVLPDQRVIIAYIQPDVKMLRVTRKAATKESAGATEIVLKKHNVYPGGAPGTLLIIKGATVQEAYNRYYGALQSMCQPNGAPMFHFKRPHWNTFGVMTETWGEFGPLAPLTGGATVAGLQSVLSHYQAAEAPLSIMTFGTGYWSQIPDKCCEHSDWEFYYQPTIETLAPKEPYVSPENPGLAGFFASLSAMGIYPLVGMRHHATTTVGNTLPYITGEQFLASRFAAVGVSNPYIPGSYYYRPDYNLPVGLPDSPPARLLDTSRADVISTFIDFTQEAYGPFRGMKEDEMLLANAKHISNVYDNLPDGTVGKVYAHYDTHFGGDFVIIGRNDWFGVATDGQNGQGWVDVRPTDGTYRFKYALDAALTQVVSGYPHPKPEWRAVDVEVPDDAPPQCAAISDCSDFCSLGDDVAQRLALHEECCKIPDADQQEFLREAQLHTFLALDMHSRGFWHLASQGAQDVFTFFSRLRADLHQYAYDHAQRWYEDGVPHLMRPLFIDHDGAAIHELYGTTDGDAPRDEYMFGHALLVRPILREPSAFWPMVPVYFPPGKWMPLLSNGPVIQGDGTRDYILQGMTDYPVFLREGEILVMGGADPTQQDAKVFLDTMTTTTLYRLYRPSQPSVGLVAERQGATVILRNLTNGKQEPMIPDPLRPGLFSAPLGLLL